MKKEEDEEVKAPFNQKKPEETPLVRGLIQGKKTSKCSVIPEFLVGALGEKRK